MAPEALAFGVIGALNTLVYFIISNLLWGIGEVKATVVATVVTTTLSYLANRHWTYRDRPRTALRREYTLFFAFNLAGMLIQSGVVTVTKYGLGLSGNRLAFNIAMCVGIVLATLFRFWAYRTLVFKSAPAVATIDIPATPGANLLAPAQRHGGAEADEFTKLTAALEAELASPEALASAEALAAARSRDLGRPRP